MSRDQGVITGRLHPLVMVGVDTHFVLLQVEGELAGLHGLQLVVAVQVGPPPQAAVEDVGQPLPVGHLEASIQGPEQRVQPGQRGASRGVGAQISAAISASGLLLKTNISWVCVQPPAGRCVLACCVYSPDVVRVSVHACRVPLLYRVA